MTTSSGAWIPRLRRVACVLALAAIGCDGAQPPTDGGGEDGGPSTRDGGPSTRDGGDVPAPDGGDAPDGGGGGPTDGGRPFVPRDWCATGDTVLATTARSVEPGTFVEMPANASLAALPMERALLFWADSAAWDPGSRQVLWTGGPGTCCTDGRPTDYQHLRYDVASDTWSIQAAPFDGSGHAYDANAVHPVTGEHYFALFGMPGVRRYAGRAWLEPLPDVPFRPAVAVALTWFPELRDGAGALLYVNGNGQTAIFDGVSWTEASVADAWGEYSTFAEHNPVLGLVWMGGGLHGSGTDYSRVHYTLDADLTPRRLADAPFGLGSGAGLHAADPVSGRFVVLSYQDGGWWDFDPIADRWTRLEGLVGEPTLRDGGGVFQVPIPDCGVILYFTHYYDERRVYLYRHLATP